MTDRSMWDRVKIVRERTSAGLSECRQALEEAQGDVEDAVELVMLGTLHVNRARYFYPAQVHATVSPDARTAVMVELDAPCRPWDRAEALDPFFAEVLAIAQRTPPGADLAAQPLGDSTVGAAAVELSARLGLPIAVRRWTQLAAGLGASELCAAHVTSRRDLGAIVVVTAPSAPVAAHPGTRRFTDELAMWICVRMPKALDRTSLDPALIAEKRALLADEASLLEQSAFAPDEIELWKHRSYEFWIARQVLLEQRWGWDFDATTVDARRRAASIEAGGELRIARFAWFARGGST